MFSFVQYTQRSSSVQFIQSPIKSPVKMLKFSRMENRSCNAVYIFHHVEIYQKSSVWKCALCIFRKKENRLKFSPDRLWNFHPTDETNRARFVGRAKSLCIRPLIRSDSNVCMYVKKRPLVSPPQHTFWSEGVYWCMLLCVWYVCHVSVWCMCVIWLGV